MNVIGVCICTREFMKQAKEGGVEDGHIFLLNGYVVGIEIHSNCCAIAFPPTCSMSGHQVVSSIAGSNAHFYSVTKFGITAIMEGVRRELRAMNSCIKITVSTPLISVLVSYWNIKLRPLVFLYQGISPGTVRTEFMPRVMKANDIEKAKRGYDDVVQGVSSSKCFVPPRSFRGNSFFCSPWSQKMLREPLCTHSPLRHICRLYYV